MLAKKAIISNIMAPHVVAAKKIAAFILIWLWCWWPSGSPESGFVGTDYGLSGAITVMAV